MEQNREPPKKSFTAQHWPELALLAAGLPMMALLLYLAALSEGWVCLLCILGAAVVYTGWHRVLIELAWKYSGKDPDDYDFNLPG